MSEKPKLPAEILNAAARALYERDGYNYAAKDLPTHRAYWREAQWQAKCALEAAGVPELIAAITAYFASLRDRIADLEAQRERAGKDEKLIINGKIGLLQAVIYDYERIKSDGE